MGLAGGILVGFVPAIAWLWFFWRKDEGRREPKRLMLRVFGAGALMAGPIFLLEGNLPLPPICPADYNGDGNLDILDFVAFQVGWLAGETAADCDGNGSFDILDFICFQSAFVSGCP